jgi:hypothetical protein
MRRGMVLAAMAGLAVFAVVLLRPAPAPERPVATVGHAGVEPAPTTTAAAPAPTTTTTAKPRVAATRGTTVVRADGGGLTVVNEGSATASSGNNTVIGPPSATVNEGPVTAIGNTADVRIRP